MRKITKLIIRIIHSLLENGGECTPVNFIDLLKFLNKTKPNLSRQELVNGLVKAANLGLIFLSSKYQAMVPAEIFQILTSSKGGRFLYSDCTNLVLWRHNKNAVCLGCSSKSCKCTQPCECCGLMCPFCPDAKKRRMDIMGTSSSTGWFSKIKNALCKQ